MSDRTRDIERLNALIDGELTADQQAAILEKVAADPALAQELSALSRLKAEIATSVEVPEIDLPPGPRAQASWRRSVVALAASLALVAVVGLLWFFNAIQTPDRGLPVAWAVAAHHGWVLPPRSSAPLAPLSPARLGADTYVPDLAAAKLRVVHVGVLPASGGGEALIVGYAGTRGCKVTLLVAPAAAGRGAAPIRLAMGPIRALAWAAGNRSYMVLAEGMPASRFHLIADSIRRASLERLPLDEAARTALADSRAKSRPCAA